MPWQNDENNAVVSWFGEAFFQLHPDLQLLHRDGGTLIGKISLTMAKDWPDLLANAWQKNSVFPCSRASMN